MLLLPVYIDALGATQTQIGWVMASASLGGLAFRPLVGWALDTRGRKPTMVTGTVVLTIAMVLLGFVQDIGPLVYGARCLVGIGAGALFTGYFAWVSDFIPPSRRTEGLALFGVSGLAPIALNGVIHRLSIPVTDLNLLYPGLSILVAASIPLLILVPETTTLATHRKTSSISRTVGALLQSVVRPTWGATIIFASLVAVFMSFATVTAQYRGISTPADIWFFYASGAIGVRIFGAKLPDKIGPSNMVIPALACYASAYLLIAQTSSITDIWWAGLMAGFGHGYCFPVLTSQVISRTPDEIRGSALAVFTALWEICALGMTPFFGWISDTYGSRVMFTLGVLLVVFFSVFWVISEHRAMRSLTTRCISNDTKKRSSGSREVPREL